MAWTSSKLDNTERFQTRREDIKDNTTTVFVGLFGLDLQTHNEIGEGEVSNWYRNYNISRKRGKVMTQPSSGDGRE